MSIDVSTLSVEVKSVGIKDTTKDLSNLNQVAGNTIKRVDTLTASVTNLMNAFTSGTASAIAYQNAVAAANRQVGGHNAATSALTQAMTSLSGAIGTLNTNLGNLNLNTTRSTQSIRGHTNAMADAHAAARGLAGSLGVLWTTYGNMLPLAAGLAIGTSLREIVKVGADVENTLEGIRVKGDETFESVGKMRDAIMSLGKGMYGPQEVAKSFEVLILAGLNAQQALVGIKDAMNLAVVGGTTIEKASTTLVQVSTALGYTAEGFGHVGDVIAKTAAVSMSSVESLSEAFKAASSVGKMYGATLVDIGTGLAALAQLGIQGSAAGTSLKNFYKELSSNADKLKNVLGALNMKPKDLKDANGEFLDMVTVVGKLSDGLNKLLPDQQKLALANLANERGLKTLVEVLDLYRTKIDATVSSTGEASNALSEFRAKIADNAAYTAAGAAQMALTTENQFKAMKNTLLTSFTDAFKGVNDPLLVLTVRLKEAFGSPEFVSAIQGIATALAELAVYLVENANTVKILVEGILAFKAAAMVIGVIQGLAAAFVALTEAFAAAKLGAIAFQASLGIIGIVLGIAGAAWAYYATQKSQATTGDKQAAGLATLKDYADNLGKEADRMEEVNRLMREGKSAREAETTATQDGALALAQLNKQKAIEAAQGRLKTATTAYISSQTNLTAPALAKAAQKEYEDAAKNMQQTEQTVNRELATVEINISRMRSASREQAAMQDARAEAERAKARAEAGTGSLPEKGNKAAENAIKNETMALLASAAAYRERTRATEEATRTGVKAEADTASARVNAELAAGKYGDKVSEAAKADLRAAAAADDAAKFTANKSQALNELSVSLSKQLDVEKSGLAEANAGHSKLTSVVETETAAKLKLWGVMEGSDLYTKYMAEAKAVGELTAAKERALKFEKGTENLHTEAMAIGQAADAMALYGKKGKETALQIAALQIAQAKLDPVTQSGIINSRNSEAALKDLNTAYEAMVKMTNDLSDQGRKDDAAAVAAILTSEGEKVQAKRATMLKAIEFSTMEADAAIAAARAAGPVTAEQETAYQNAIAARTAAMAALNKMTEDGMSRGSVKDMNTMLAESKTLAGDMATAFGSVGGAIGGVVTAMVGLTAAQTKYNDQLHEAANARSSGDEVTALKIEKEATAQRAQAQVKSYADMAGAAKGFFKEGTTGYKVLSAAEKAFRVYEMALAYESMIRKIFFTEATTTAAVTGNAASAQSAVAGAAVEVPAKMAIASASAVGAVANQGSGDPYTAFFRIGAMIAIMAALGLAVGGGGGSAPPVDIAKQRQDANGTGTVLGDESAKSDSIAKAMEILKSNSNIALTYTSNMLSALRNIESGISSMAAAISQTTGLRGTTADQYALGVGSSSSFAGFSKSSTELVDSGISFGPAQPALTDAQRMKMAGWDMADVSLPAAPTQQTVGSVRSGGIDAQGYADLHKESSSWWGLSKSSSNESQFSALDKTLKDEMTRTIGALYEGVVQAATVFGKDRTTLEAALNNITLKDAGLDKISLKGLSGADIEKELSAAFSKVGDVMAKAAMPGLDAFQKVGEGYFQTLVRVATGIDSANLSLERLGITAVDYTNVTNKQGDVATEIVRDSIAQVESQNNVATGIGEIVKTMDGTADDIVTTYKALRAARDMMSVAGLGDNLNRNQVRGAGSLENLTSGLNAYYDNFFSTADQQKMHLALVRKEFENLNLVMPTSRAEFRKAVEAASALGTEVGDETVGKLLSLADAFQGVVSATDDLTKTSNSLTASQDIQNRLLTAQGNALAVVYNTRQAELAAASDVEKVLLRRVYMLEDEQRAIDAGNKYKTAYIEILKLQGNAEGALALQRQIELSTTEETLKPLKQYLYLLQDAQTATNLANKANTTYAEILKLEGDTAGATAVQRNIELAAMDASLRPLQERLYALQDEAAANAMLAKGMSIQANILTLQGDAEGALAIQRQAELAGMDASLRPLQQRLYFLQDEAKAVDALNKGTSMMATILTAEGKTTEATALTRQTELAAMDASLRPLQERINALDDEKAALDNLKTANGMLVTALQAAGGASQALAIQRRQELDAMDASLRPIQQLIYALTDEKTAADNAAAALDAAKQKLDAAKTAMTDAFNAIGSIAQTALDNLKKSVDAQKTVLQKAYDAEVQALKDHTDVRVQAAKDAYDLRVKATKADFEAQKKAVQDKAKLDVDAQKVSLKTATDALNAIQSIFDTIKSAIQSTAIASYEMDKARRAQAHATIDGALASANTGGSLAGYAGLGQALADIQKPSEQFYATFEDYAREQAQTKLQLEQLGGKAGEQVDKAQLTIDAINATIDAINAASDAQIKALDDLETKTLDGMQVAQDALVKGLEDQRDAQISAMQQALQSQFDALDAMVTNSENALTVASGGVVQAAMTVADAQASFSAAVGAVQAAHDAMNSVTATAAGATNDAAATLAGAVSTFNGAMAAVQQAQADVNAAQATANSTSAALAQAMADALSTLQASSAIAQAAGDTTQTAMLSVQMSAAAAAVALQAIQTAANAATKSADATQAAADGALAGLQSAVTSLQTSAQAQTTATNATNALASLMQSSADAHTAALNTVGSALTALANILSAQTTALAAVANAPAPSATPPVTAQPAPGPTATDQAINSLFQMDLGRDAGADGLKFYEAQIAAGGSISDVEAAIKASPEYAVRHLYETLLGREPDASGYSYYMDELVNKGYTTQQVEDQIKHSPEYLGSFDVGTNYMPSDGIAQVHEGERIVPKADNIELMRRLKSPDEGVDAKAELAQALRDLKEAIRDGDVANVQTTKELYKLFRKWDNNGMPDVRITVE